jgi:hypothetical protein
MAITGENINTKLKILIQDDTNIRWTKDEICGWINSAQREILIHKPNANPTIGNVATVIGTKQSLPVGAIQLLDVTRNMGTTAMPAAGKVITNIPRSIIDRIAGWHKATTYVTSTVGVDHYAFDERFPTTFYVWPGLSDTGFVEGLYAALPTDLTISEGAIAGSIFNDLYETPILDYCAYRCYSKDAEYTENLQRAAAFYASFVGAITEKSKAEIGFAPVTHLESKKSDK